nr:DUF5916 domain-containing protein [uncultured Undibacterium sp.]
MSQFHTIRSYFKKSFASYAKSTMVLPRTLLCASAFLIGNLAVQNLAQANTGLQIPRAAKPPVLSDYINGLPTQHGVEIKDFRQYKPGNGIPASQDTKAYLSYDDTHFYAVFVTKVDPKLIRANMTKRENIMGDDEMVLEIDTFHDKQRAFVFHINPYGIQFDGKRTEGANIDFNFDTQWESDGQITKDGFVGMMAIPFKSLRFNSTDVQTWGIAVGRIVGGINEWSFWPNISNQNATFVGQMADMTIPAKLTPGRNVQINPSLFLGNKRLLNHQSANSPVWQEEKKSRPGLDAKWVIGDAIAVDLTINPDFSEVESDEPQALVNKRYETLFPEKRPFFLENAGFFQTPQPLFFSRRIIEPKAGARLTGREGAWSFGGLLIDDQAVGKLLPTSHPSYGKSANIAVARVQNDFAKGSNIGAILTERRLGNISNSVIGSDLRYALDKNWSLTAQLAHSVTKDGNTIQKDANLGHAEIKHTGRNLNYSFKYVDIGADFDRRLAFLPRTDVRQITQKASYLWDQGASPYFHQVGGAFNAIVTKDHDNKVQDWNAESALILKTKFSTDINIVNLNSYEYYAGKGFQKNGNGISVLSEYFDWMSVNLIAGSDDLINYSPAAGQEPTISTARDVSLTLGIKPLSQLRIDQTVLFNNLRSRSVMANEPHGSTIYRDLVFRTKFAYQVNRFLGLRLVLDYHNLQANPLLSSLKSGKQLNQDLQLSYIVGPGTTLYAGYANRQENIALIGNPQRVIHTDKLDLMTGRSVFMKLNYLFQL